METFSALLAICAGNSPVIGIPRAKASELWCFLWFAPEKGNCWKNNGAAGDLRRHRAHYDVTVMMCDNKPVREHLRYYPWWKLWPLPPLHNIQFATFVSPTPWLLWWVCLKVGAGQVDINFFSVPTNQPWKYRNIHLPNFKTIYAYARVCVCVWVCRCVTLRCCMSWKRKEFGNGMLSKCCNSFPCHE